MSLYDCIAPTWQGVYLEGVHRLLSPPPAAQPQYVGPELGRWVNNWVTRKMLLYMQHKRRHEPRQPPEVWQKFGQLFLPKWDRDFVRRALWRKLPLGTRMERLGGKLCPLDGRVEDHEHVSRHCMFGAFMQSTVRKAFGLVDSGGVKVEPSRLLRDFPLLSITTTQGLLLWAGLKAQWNLWCRAKYQHQPATLDEFIAGWAGVLRRWRAESNMSVPRCDLFLFINILDGWFDNPAMPGIFQGPPQQPTTVGGGPQVDKLQVKEAKWGAYKTKVVAELETLSGEGWTVVYTDGSAKVVRGWAQAGFGAWYGPGSPRNISDFVPLGEKQSVSRAEIRGVLHAVRSRQWEEHMVVVLDSECVFKGITQWSSKWQRHEWRVSGREVEHKELWMAVLAERELAGDRLQVRWVPSHLGVAGNEEADQLAEQGRLLHPYNEESPPKRRRLEQQWEELGLEEMSSGEGEASDSGYSLSTGSLLGEGDTSGASSSLSSQGWVDSEEYSTDVSDNPRKRGRRAEPSVMVPGGAFMDI